MEGECAIGHLSGGEAGIGVYLYSNHEAGHAVVEGVGAGEGDGGVGARTDHVFGEEVVKFPLLRLVGRRTAQHTRRSTLGAAEGIVGGESHILHVLEEDTGRFATYVRENTVGCGCLVGHVGILGLAVGGSAGDTDAVTLLPRRVVGARLDAGDVGRKTCGDKLATLSRIRLLTRTACQHQCRSCKKDIFCRSHFRLFY